MGVTSNGNALFAKLAKRFKRFQGDSPELHSALTLIGLLITSRAKLNVRRMGMIDTGRLINSLRYEFYKTNQVQGIKIGSFGVPYAAIHEFGGPFTERMRRAMFAELARRGRLTKDRQSKGVVRGDFIRARPYLRPALVSTRPYTLSILREALNLKD